MIPSRDSSQFGDSVAKPSLMPQVKVLRRPQPAAVDQPSTSSIGQDNKINTTTSIKLRTSGTLNEPHDNTETRIVFSEDQWPSLADTINNSSRSQGGIGNTNAIKNPETRQPNETTKSPKIISRNNNNYNKNPQHQRPQQTTCPSLSGESNQKRHPMLKSYKERADEYAKARLRILGSAFSEDDSPGDTNS